MLQSRPQTGIKLSMHNEYILKALSLAKPRQGFCAPNPPVGALFVKDGQVIGEGTHMSPGSDHAEVMAQKAALAEVGSEGLAGATLYVTLEPCCHWGKTPPCTELLIEASIKTVVFALYDPNPKVSGLGIAALTKAGIECVHVPLAEVDDFYQPYSHWIATGKPWVVAKLAMSLDGQYAADNPTRLMLTSEQAQRYTHEGRGQSDALLTTACTTLKDDPQLNVRLGDTVVSKPLYILNTRGCDLKDATVMKTASHITQFCDAAVSAEVNHDSAAISTVGVASSDGQLDLDSIIAHIGDAGVHQLWVEAGGTLIRHLLARNLIDQLRLYVTPKWLGDGFKQAFTQGFDLTGAHHVRWQPLGVDACCEVTLTEPAHLARASMQSQHKVNEPLQECN